MKEELATDWIQVLITFRSACYHCRKEISPGQAFWSNSAKAAKHLVCKRTKAETVITNEIETLRHNSDDPIPSCPNPPQIIDLKCFLCGAKTGCHECTYLNECVQRFSSEEYCVCKSCSSNSEGPGSYERYKQIFVQNAKTHMNV